MSTERVLADFAGNWHLTKHISHADGAEAVFDGQAIWSPDARGLRYDERGQLSVAGHPPMHTTRAYVWTPDLTVLFEDGRVFHTVPAVGGPAHHHCAPDDYHVQYDFDAWPRFDAVWRVVGPRKNYVMKMRYSRAG